MKMVVKRSGARFMAAFFLIGLLSEAGMLLAGHLGNQAYSTTAKTIPGLLLQFEFLVFVTVLAALILLVSPRPLLFRFDQRRWVIFVGVAAATINIAYFLTINTSVRYISGAVYDNLAIYLVKAVLNYSFMLLAVREKWRSRADGDVAGTRKSNAVAIIWFLSSALVLDGLAPAMTLFCFAFLMIDVRKKRRLAIAGILAGALLSLGVAAKYAERDVNPTALVGWSIARLVINDEQLYTAMNTDQFGSTSRNWGVVLGQAEYGVKRLLTKEYSSVRFKTFSEYLYFSLYGADNSGSTPGALLASYLLGGIILSPLLLAISLYPAYAYFCSLPGKVSMLQLIALLFLLKPSHSDLPGVIAVISISCLLYFLTFAIGATQSNASK